MSLCKLCFFFFSSRRRHTRSLRDWSSDVCSSDLEVAQALLFLPVLQRRQVRLPVEQVVDLHQVERGQAPQLERQVHLGDARSEEHTSELQSRRDLVCRLLLEKKKKNTKSTYHAPI